MTIGKRILTGYIIVLILSTLVCGGGVFAIVHVRHTYDMFLATDAKVILDVVRLRIAVEQQSSAFRGYILYRDPTMLTQWHEAAEDFDALHAQLSQSIEDASEQAILDEIEVANREWRARQQDRIDAGTGTTGVGLDELDAQRRNSRQAIMDKMQSFFDRRSQIIEDSSIRLSRRINQMIAGIVALAVLALVAGLGISFWTTDLIGRTLRDAIGRLASSTSEISAMIGQVASSAAETAASVSETSSTVEEVRQTATLSANKAKAVSQSAQRSVETSESGRRAVETSMHGMDAIREQMETIAQSVIRLSEQGQAIGEIIATVNDLADQSNLLAVNASIEAARAGEHGKGFGVVAQEVKSLADQSKLATAQVRSILGEIQRAAGAAVMATEQGNKAVEAGVDQANALGAAIEQLAMNITEAAQSATQIAASSQQQLAGMDQVSLAMENISEASKQNASGTGQAESAAEDLKLLAERLRSLIEKNGTPRGL